MTRELCRPEPTEIKSTLGTRLARTLILVVIGGYLAGCCSIPRGGETRFATRVVIKFDPIFFPGEVRDGTHYVAGAERHFNRTCRNPDFEQTRNARQGQTAAQFVSCAAVWEQLSREFGPLRLHPVFSGLKPKEISELVAQAKNNNPRYVDPNFFMSFFVARRPSSRDAHQLVAALRKLPFVRSAYIDIAAPMPGLVEKDAETAGYVDPALKGGLGIDSAWEKADGSKVNIAVIDRGWLLEKHPDLPDLPNAAAGRPDYADYSQDFGEIKHGTAALGIVVAKDKTGGISGIAPKAGIVLASVISDIDEEDYATVSVASVENAILTAAKSLNNGDVMLVEYQTRGLLNYFVPAEQKGLVFDAIATATSGKKLIVIEPSGNFNCTVVSPLCPDSGNNLDKDKDTNLIEGEAQGVLNRSLIPGGPNFADSGAIWVGAARASITAAGAHERLAYVNSGAAIHTYAWGEGVKSTGLVSNVSPPPPRFVPGPTDTVLTMTSAASAIIAGAALLIQNICEAEGKARLTPAEMRAVLGSNSGTPVIDLTGTGTPIGYMPDLKKFICRP